MKKYSELKLNIKKWENWIHHMSYKVYNFEDNKLENIIEHVDFTLESLFWKIILN